MDITRAIIALAIVGFAGCASGFVEEEQGDPNESFLISVDGKADNFGVADGTPRAIAVLNVANTHDVRVLSELVGLSDRVIRGIDEHRLGPDGESGTRDDNSFDTLAELDAVPWFGPSAFAAVVRYVDEQGLVQTPETYGWPEGGAAARQILDVANSVYHSGYMFQSRHLTQSIFNYVRRHGPIESLAQLARLPGVTAETFHEFWAWGIRQGIEGEAKRRVYDKSSLANGFDPNLCTGPTMTADYADVLLGDEDDVVISNGIMVHYQGHTITGEPQKMGDGLVRARLRRYQGDILAYAGYQAVNNEWRENWCNLNEGNCTFRITPHCAIAEFGTDHFAVFHIGGAAPIPQRADGPVGAPANADDDHILTTANTVSLVHLDDLVGLSSPAAQNIVEARSGLDGVDGTADDTPFTTVDSLDAVPQVGPATLQKLLVFGRAHDLRTGNATAEDLSNAQMPYDGDWDPMSCTGPELTVDEATTKLLGRTLRATHYKRTNLFCRHRDDCEVREHEAEAELVVHESSAGPVLSLRSPFVLGSLPVSFSDDGTSGFGSYTTGGERWQYEARQSCVKFWLTQEESVVVFRF